MQMGGVQQRCKRLQPARAAFWLARPNDQYVRVRRGILLPPPAPRSGGILGASSAPACVVSPSRVHCAPAWSPGAQGAHARNRDSFPRGIGQIVRDAARVHRRPPVPGRVAPRAALHLPPARAGAGRRRVCPVSARAPRAPERLGCAGLAGRARARGARTHARARAASQEGRCARRPWPPWSRRALVRAPHPLPLPPLAPPPSLSCAPQAGA